ncbi:MAG: ABC transporter ATP-binding protein [Clostridia bacterium]|nr:ABC transporter ATP-binding protein [Clostridia bacterium]
MDRQNALFDSAQLAAEHKEQIKRSRRERLLTIDPDCATEDIVALFVFDLPDREADAASHAPRVNGLAVVFPDRIAVYVDGKSVRSFSLKEVTDFRVHVAVGSVTAECTVNGETQLICRATKQHANELGAVIKQLTAYRKSGVYCDDYLQHVACYCEHCGRPFLPGSAICPFCTKKAGVIKRLWEIARPFKWHLLTAVLLFFCITLVNLITPSLNRVLVDEYINTPTPETVSVSGFIGVIVSMAVVQLFSHALSVLRNRALIRSSNHVVVSLRELVFAKIQAMSIGRIAQRTAGSLMQRVTNDTVVIRDFITNVLPEFVQEVLVLLFISVYLFVYDWRLALLILLPTPFVIASFRFVRKRLRLLWRRRWNVGVRANSILHDIFSGIRVVKAFGMEDYESNRFDVVSADYRDASIKASNHWQTIHPILHFMIGIGEFFLLFYVGNRILDGTMTLGQMAQFSTYVSMLYTPLRWLSMLPQRLVDFGTSATKLFEIIDETIDIDDKPNAKTTPIRGTVDFNNVSFGYDNTTDVLNGINLHVEPGEMIGIVGRSGVGKTTLINLLMRLYDVEGGSICIDGIDLRDFSQESLRSQIGVVLQETFLFAGTVYDNIAYAKPTATRDEVLNAAKVAGAHEFIMRLPDAYNTQIGEKGYTLSGGERQRISIARALLHDPRILILDEATAALDTVTERQIQNALQKLMQNRTTFAIAHRLSTLRNATRLIVLDKGVIAEVGPHEELLRKKGIYYNLVIAQRQMSNMAPKKT